MSVTTVEFFKVFLKETGSKRELDIVKLKTLFEEIFRREGKDCKKYISIDLSPDRVPNDIEPKEVLDIFRDDKYLFGRICRQKSNNAILKRDYDNLIAQDVFTDAEARKRGIEVFTFFILDFVKGILAMANAKGAPGEHSLDSLFKAYNNSYYLEFANIPNEEGINMLYNSKNPKISGFEFDVPSPNAEFLQRVLGLDEDIIKEIIQNDVMTATVMLKPVPYQKMIKGPNKVKEILDILKRKKKNFSKCIVRGGSEDFNSRRFDLHAKYFTYPIEVRKYRQINGKNVEYSLEEIIEQFRIGLHRAYEMNYDLLLAIADRRGE